MPDEATHPCNLLAGGGVDTPLHDSAAVRVEQFGVALSVADRRHFNWGRGRAGLDRGWRGWREGVRRREGQWGGRRR